MTQIDWAPSAISDLEIIVEYLETHLPHLELLTIKEIIRMAESLRSFPERGRPGRISGTRELVFTRLSYVLVYRPRLGGVVEIVRIIHAARDRSRTQ